MKKILGIIFLFLMLSCFDNTKDNQNLENSKKLKTGMSFNEAIVIMGQPISVKKTKNNSFYNYDTKLDSIYEFFYGRPTGASSGILFKTDSVKILKVYNKLD